MEIIGFVCAMLVGISLGVLGSGGSILTVPIMVFLFNINPVAATGYSLFVVGITSAIGCATYIRKKLVDIRTALIFAVPSIISVFITRHFLMTSVPDIILKTDSYVLTKDLFIMILFAILMMIIAYNMIHTANYKEADQSEVKKINYLWLVSIGFVSGILTGALGVGGGFIIIPALVLFAKIPIKMSVGTSLLIIAFNSLSGFIQEVITKHENLDFKFLFIFSLISILGIFIGFRLTMNLYPSQMKRTFGWFVLVMGICVFIKEVFLN